MRDTGAGKQERWCWRNGVGAASVVGRREHHAVISTRTHTHTDTRTHGHTRCARLLQRGARARVCAGDNLGHSRGRDVSGQRQGRVSGVKKWKE